MSINQHIESYNITKDGATKEICNSLSVILCQHFSNAEAKIWHAHPVWFIDGNPIVGYSVLKAGVRLMFWSGADFDEPQLQPGTGKFKDASILYTAVNQIKEEDIIRWIEKARHIQWDYKNIVKRKGVLQRLK